MKRDPEVISYTMSRIKGKDTGIEMALRKRLQSEGVSYRVCSGRVYGHPDIVIQKYKIAIFADSEFWHGKDFDVREASIKSNRDYWLPKIRRNIERDKEVNAELSREGYTVLRFWGEEIEKDFETVIAKILSAIEDKKRVYELKSEIKELTTLCYIEKDDCYLLLHRVKKKQDLNEGKWIGVGGHLEKGESPAACMKREILEETGLIVDDYRYMGKINFLNDQYPPERMYLYKVTSFHGEMIECDEGELAWVKKGDILSLNLWEGDKVFLPLLDTNETSPFELDLVYQGGELTSVYGPGYPALKKKMKSKKKRKKSK